MDQDAIKSTKNEIEPCRYAVDICIPAGRVDSEYGAVERRYQMKQNVPGFRPGKTPLSLIRKRFGDHIASDVRERLVMAGLQAAIEQESLEPLTFPGLQKDKISELMSGADFRFTMEFDVAPKLDLPDYAGYTLTHEPADVTDKQVDDSLDKLRQEYASFEKVERVAEPGDMVKASYRAELPEDVGDIPSAAERLIAAEDTWLALDENGLFPGLVDAMTGTAPEDKVAMTIAFPDDYDEPFLAGKTVPYEFLISEVYGREPPELDDAFAATIRPGMDLDTLRSAIRTQLEQVAVQSRTRELHDQIRDNLLDTDDFPLPPEMLQKQTMQLLRQMVTHNHDHDGPCDHSEEEMRVMFDEKQPEAEEVARKSLKLRLLLEAIADKEKIEVSKEEVAAMMADMCRNMQLSEADFKKRFDIKELSGRLYDDIFHEKVMGRLLELADVKDGKPSE